MENKVVKNNSAAVIRLLPNYCKKIGFALSGIVVLFFICLLINSIFHPSFKLHAKDIFKYVVFFVFTTGLVIISISKDKVEDELTMVLRVKAMAIAFLGGITCCMIWPFASLIVEGYAISIKSPELILIIISTYTTNFYLLKRAH
jgi:hypothetical protein